MQIKVKPHPNYLKVIHSYIWSVFFCYCGAVIACSNSSVYSVLFILTGLFIPFLLFRRVLSNFIKKETSINTFTIKTIDFCPFFLEKAYGVGSLVINNQKIKGIHVDDFQRIKRCLES